MKTKGICLAFYITTVIETGEYVARLAISPKPISSAYKSVPRIQCIFLGYCDGGVGPPHVHKYRKWTMILRYVSLEGVAFSAD